MPCNVDSITTKVGLIAHKLRDTKTNANIDWFWRKKTVRGVWQHQSTDTNTSCIMSTAF